jgi:hypothetical protein
MCRDETVAVVMGRRFASWQGQRRTRRSFKLSRRDLYRPHGYSRGEDLWRLLNPSASPESSRRGATVRPNRASPW